MNKFRCIWNDFFHNFFSKRLLTFCIFQYSILHYYISSVKRFSFAAAYPASPWILPFIGQNVYCLFVYGISVVYFYSNIPFTQNYEMYALLRQGRKRWMFTKILRIVLLSAALSIIELIFSIIMLLPHLEWTAEWGKLYNSLAMTNAGLEYNVKMFFSYELINENNAITTLLIFLAVMCLVTSLTGIFMFTVSIWINRMAAVLAGSFLAILPVVFANLYLYQEWISFVSPFSWLNLLLVYGKVCQNSPSLTWITVVSISSAVILCLISFIGIQKKEINWTEEE